MKKLLSIVLVVIMAVTIITAAGARPETQRSCSADALEDSEVIMFIPAGENDDCVGYLEEDYCNVGPESFVVSNRGIYILDSVKNRIIVNENGIKRHILIEGVTHPTFMALAGDCFFVVDESSMKAIDKNSGYCHEVSLPKGITPDDLFRLYVDNDQLCLLTHDLVCYRADACTCKWILSHDISVNGQFEEYETVVLPDRKVDIKVGSTSLAQYLQHTANELIIGVYEFVPSLPIIETEYTIRKYDLQGRLKGCTVINNLESYSIPNDTVFIDPLSQDVYTMLCREEGVYITKPNFRIDYQSHMNELTEIAEESVESIRSDEPTRDGNFTNEKRYDVLDRADDAKNHQWTLQAVNKAATGFIELPVQVASANVGVTMDRIPYCFGGYFTSITTGFDNLLNTSVTGNIDHNHGHATGTIGLDCSGFVSYAYNISYHGTKTLKNYGYSISSSVTEASVSNLELMDFLVKYTENGTGNHTLLYRSMSNGEMNTRECTTLNNTNGVSSTIHGVKIRTLDLAYLSGYVLRTPYVCGSTENQNHDWSGYHYDSSQHWKECTVCGKHKSTGDHTWSGYQYNATQHWKECTVCGKHKSEANHIWAAYGNNYRCSTCGWVVSSIPQPTGIQILHEKI